MIKGLGSFTLIKNEKTFIKAHLASWLPHLEQMVLYDGNSTDGTLEIIKEAKSGPNGNKIKLFENKDPKNLTDSYEIMFNECMWSLDTDLAIFLHPDMFLEDNKIDQIPSDTVAATVNMKSFAGEPGKTVFEIKGRGKKWKNIYRLRKPDLGAHYHGFYGAANEDTYFSEITGEEYIHYSQDFHLYPYKVCHTGLTILHYSDVRPVARRLDRMKKCLINQGMAPDRVELIAPNHPRVNFKNNMGFTFIPVETPVFLGGN